MRWTERAFARLRDLAADGEYASAIARDIGTSHASILTMAARHGIDVAKYTPDEQAEMDRRYRERQKRKNEKRNAASRAAPACRPVEIGISRTSVVYRNRLPLAPEMTKGELRAFLAQAVRNTAEATR